MPKNALSACDLNAIYTGTWIQTVLWGYVSAQRRCGVEAFEAIRDFINYFQLTNINEETLYKMYTRKQTEYNGNMGEVRRDMERYAETQERREKERTREQLRELSLFVQKKVNDIDV